MPIRTHFQYQVMFVSAAAHFQTFSYHIAMATKETSEKINLPTQKDSLRETVARFLFVIAFALLVFACVLAGILWLTAKRDGMLPSPDWEHWTSNHGPWRHYQGMVLFDALTVTLLTCSVVSLLTILVKFYWHRGLLFVIAVLGFWYAFGYGIFLDD